MPRLDGQLPRRSYRWAPFCKGRPSGSPTCGTSALTPTLSHQTHEAQRRCFITAETLSPPATAPGKLDARSPEPPTPPDELEALSACAPSLTHPGVCTLCTSRHFAAASQKPTAISSSVAAQGPRGDQGTTASSAEARPVPWQGRDGGPGQSDWSPEGTSPPLRPPFRPPQSQHWEPTQPHSSAQSPGHSPSPWRDPRPTWAPRGLRWWLPAQARGSCPFANIGLVQPFSTGEPRERINARHLNMWLGH